MAMNFTIVHSAKTNDEDADAGDVPEIAVTGWLHFVAQMPEGMPALAPDVGDDGTSYWVRTFTAYLDDDGVLKNKPGADGGTPGVRLWASDPAFNLEPPGLPYLVYAPKGLRANGKIVPFEPFVFYAPAEDVEKKFSELAPVPSATAKGIARGPIGFTTRWVVVSEPGDPVMWQQYVVEEDRYIGDPVSDLTDVESVLAAQDIPGQVVAEVAAQDIPGQVAEQVAAQDISGQVVDAVAADSTVIDAAAAAVTADIAGRDLVEGHTIARDDVAFAIVDSTDRQLITIYKDGTARIFKLDPASISDGTIEAAKLSAAVRSQLVSASVGPMLDSLPTTSGYLWVLTDTVGRVMLGVKSDGSVVGKLPATSLTPNVLAEVSGTTPTRKLFALNQSAGTRTLITAANDPHDEQVLADGTILFTDNTGRKAYAGGSIIPANPNRATIAAFGDSWTHGLATPWWPDKLADLTGRTVANKGESGQTADEIAIRQGGYILQLTVAGGSIPTSGPVTVTTTQPFLLRSDNPWTQLGSLAGVPGTLTHTTGDPAGQYTFTRTSSGAAVPVAGATPFTSADAATYESNPQILFCGRNDVLNAGNDWDVVASVVAAYDAMVARLRAYHKEFLVLGTINGSDSQGLGSFYWLRVTGINNALAARYGNRFVDLRQYVNQQCIYDLGITPTPTDLANMAADMPPPSIMANTGHFNQAAALMTAEKLIKPKIDQLGWTL